jgi:hypothetical protein
LAVASAAFQAGITLSVGVPYFVVCSFNGSKGSFVTVNVLTGQIYTTTTSTARTIGTTTAGAYQIGAIASSGDSPLSYIHAAMYSAGYLSLQQLLAWAQSPWDFWYPPTAFDALLSMLRGSSAGFPVTATVLAAIEAAASPRPILISPVEPSASLAPNMPAPDEFAGAVGLTTVAPEESAASVFAREGALAELASGARLTAPSPIEWSGTAATVIGTVNSPIEFGAGVKLSILSPADSGASLRGSIAVPTAGSASLAPTEQVDIEWTGTAATIIGTVNSPIEFGSRTASRVSATVEIGHGVVVNIRAPVEWWGTVANWELTQRFGSAFWPVIYGAIVAATAPGAVFPIVSYGIVAPSGMSPMSQQLSDFPNMVASIQAQTLWIDFGKFLPSGVALSGAPTLSIANGSYSAAKDSSPSSRLTAGPSIGTISTALGGTGLTNTALLFQLSNLQPNVTYLLTYACGRSDGTDVVAGFNHVYAQPPG